MYFNYIIDIIKTYFKNYFFITNKKYLEKKTIILKQGVLYHQVSLKMSLSVYWMFWKQNYQATFCLICLSLQQFLRIIKPF